MVNNNEERPCVTLDELIREYGYKSNEIDAARKKIEFVDSVLTLKEELEEGFGDTIDTGRVYSIQAPWGMGKTSYIKILHDQILKSPKINSQQLCFYYYDSLYYGEVSEAITTVLDQLFKKVESQFAIKLSGVRDIAKNLTPSIEVSGLLARLNLVPKQTNDTNSLISEKIKRELRKIKGKIFVVIDDVDRLTSKEALHLLRMIRLLQCLPNTYIFLPLDYDALIRMLAKEDVANPGGYVRKIITKPIRLPLNFNDSNLFFKQHFADTFKCEKNEITNDHINDLWMGYLWELSLDLLAKIERQKDDPIRLQINTEEASVLWEKADILKGEGEFNFVLDFFKKTRRQYGAETSYMVKFSNESNPDLFRYYRYNFIAPETTFDRFFKGSYNYKHMVAQIGGGMQMVGGNDVFSLELYKESDVMAESGQPQKAPDNDPYQTNKEVADKLQAKKIILWDFLLGNIPEIILPKEITKHTSPRMVKRLIDELSARRKNEILALLRQPRSAGNNLYKLAKKDIEKFVEEYASE